jgi:hypothetical protein
MPAESFRDRMGEYRGRTFEKALQMRAGAAEGAFPAVDVASGEALKNKGIDPRSSLTGNGTVSIH